MDLKRATADDLAYVEGVLDRNELPAADVRADDVEMFIGSVDSTRVGVGGLERYGPYALLRSVAIEDSVRGNGYGNTLSEQLVARAQRHGVREVYLLTTTAAPFFEGLGFRTIGRHEAPPAIRETREFDELCPSSAVCMRRDLV